MKTYEYKKSKELFAKAAKIIPSGIYGHLGPSEGCFIPVDAFPYYMEKAKGPYFWDIDGNKFIDYMCAYGPNVLGYNDDRVDEAAMEQLKLGNCTVLPSTKMVELAELLTDTVESADWAFFAKNGGDVTNLAVLTARAATGRNKIVKVDGGYHGVAQWMQALGYPGITEADISNVISIPFNDTEAFEKVIAENRGDIACFISTPYDHPAMADSALPKEGYWSKMREICDREGILLIIDDVRCGFRLDTKGSDYHYGFKADLICFCKALANGYNISALCGRGEFKSAVSSVFYTGSYWLSAVPMAAAVRTIGILRDENAAKYMLETGKKITEGLKEAASKHGYELVVTGETSMWFMRLANDPSSMRHQRFVSECVRRGVFFTNHHNQFMNTSIGDKEIEFTLEVADEAFGVMEKEGV